MPDKKSNHGGARKNAGRKIGVGLSYTIQKECSVLIERLLQDELFKSKAIQQVLKLNEEEQEDYFYILKSNGFYKFGYSSNFKSRLKMYRTHNIDVKVILLLKSKGCFELESNMISLFANNRIGSSEWFNFDDEQIFNVLNHVNTINYGG
tara:strand:+ start:43 stop:492 length:450 start_codon:yes stop_codon:yes gene_type:complete